MEFLEDIIAHIRLGEPRDFASHIQLYPVFVESLPGAAYHLPEQADGNFRLLLNGGHAPRSHHYPCGNSADRPVALLAYSRQLIRSSCGKSLCADKAPMSFLVPEQSSRRFWLLRKWVSEYETLGSQQGVGRGMEPEKGQVGFLLRHKFGTMSLKCDSDNCMSAEEFLREARQVKYVQVSNPGAGCHYRIADPSLIGHVLALDGHMVHLSMFSFPIFSEFGSERTPAIRSLSRLSAAQPHQAGAPQSLGLPPF